MHTSLYVNTVWEGAHSCYRINLLGHIVPCSLKALSKVTKSLKEEWF